MNWRTLRKYATRPRLDWKQSDRHCDDDDRDFILDAEVPWETEADEPSRVYLVVTRSGHAYLEYNDSHITGPHATLLECILRAEEWAAGVARDRAKQMVLDHVYRRAQARGANS
jgi:hypothetical protein